MINNLFNRNLPFSMRKRSSLMIRWTEITKRDLILINSKITTFLYTEITRFSLTQKESTTSVCNKNSANQSNLRISMFTRCTPNYMIGKRVSESKWDTTKIWVAQWSSQKRLATSKEFPSVAIRLRRAVELIWSNICRKPSLGTSSNGPTRKIPVAIHGCPIPTTPSSVARTSGSLHALRIGL